MSAKPWTAAEDAFLRERYRRGASAILGVELGRSTCSVRHRAIRLGLAEWSRWSASETKALENLWGVRSLAGIAKQLKRPRLSVYEKARKLGLTTGVPQGFETLTAAAERTGYTTGQLRAILDWAGTEMRCRTTRSLKPGHRFHFVDAFDVDESVERWLANETIESIGERHNVTSDALRQWLKLYQAAGFDVPPAPTRKKFHWRIPSELGDRVVAWRAGLESGAGAARRYGIDRHEMNIIIAREGVKRVTPKLVAKVDVDRAMGAQQTGSKAA